MNFKIVCTFINPRDINLILDLIPYHYDIVDNRVFVFEVDDNNQLLLTYKLSKPFKMVSNSILVHRNSESNTLFTLNAMNHIIKLCNNGKFVHSYKIDWELYRNSLITYEGQELIKRGINLIDVKYFS